MSSILGKAPRHPGLWQDLPLTTNSNNAIATMSSATRGQHELQQLSGQLARLSQQGRWIVLISPPNFAYKQLLAAAGVRMDRILLVHTKDSVETLWAMEQALTSGTSSAVISWCDELDAKENRRLQLVTKHARAFGFIIEDQTHTATLSNSISSQNHTISNSMH